jgi:hypothetical protein
MICEVRDRCRTGAVSFDNRTHMQPFRSKDQSIIMPPTPEHDAIEDHTRTITDGPPASSPSVPDRRQFEWAAIFPEEWTKSQVGQAEPTVPKTKRTNCVVFIHIPKTGGQMLYQHLGSSLLPNICYPWSLRLTNIGTEQFRFWGGHYSLDDVESFFEKPITFTILRKPWAIICSLYRFFIMNDGVNAPQDAADFFRKPSLTFESFLLTEEPRILRHIDNSLTSYISGAYIAKSYESIDIEDYKRALARLESFTNIFFLEDPDLSRTLAETFGIPEAPLPLVNVSKLDHLPSDQALLNSLSGRGHRRIDELTRYDNALYEFARRTCAARERQRADFADIFGSNFIMGALRSGQEVCFHSGNPGCKLMLAGGWYAPESEFVWSRGSRAALRFRIMGEPISGLVAEFEPFVRANAPLQTIGILINGNPIIDVICIRNGGRAQCMPTWQDRTTRRELHAIIEGQKVMVTLPTASLLSDVIELEFRISAPGRPAELDGSQDTRDLGIALRRIGAW